MWDDPNESGSFASCCRPGPTHVEYYVGAVSEHLARSRSARHPGLGRTAPVPWGRASRAARLRRPAARGGGYRTSPGSVDDRAGPPRSGLPADPNPRDSRPRSAPSPDLPAEDAQADVMRDHARSRAASSPRRSASRVRTVAFCRPDSESRARVQRSTARGPPAKRRDRSPRCATVTTSSQHLPRRFR